MPAFIYLSYESTFFLKLLIKCILSVQLYLRGALNPLSYDISISRAVPV